MPLSPVTERIAEGKDHLRDREANFKKRRGQTP